jgi:hypothetical protein
MLPTFCCCLPLSLDKKHLFIRVFLSNRIYLPFSNWLVPKTCYGARKKGARVVEASGPQVGDPCHKALINVLCR